MGEGPPIRTGFTSGPDRGPSSSASAPGTPVPPTPSPLSNNKVSPSGEPGDRGRSTSSGPATALWHTGSWRNVLVDRKARIGLQPAPRLVLSQDPWKMASLASHGVTALSPL